VTGLPHAARARRLFGSTGPDARLPLRAGGTALRPMPPPRPEVGRSPGFRAGAVIISLCCVSAVIVIAALRLTGHEPF